MRFLVGDIVKLKSGWTPMQVIQVDKNGVIKAKYCHKDQLTHEDFCYPWGVSRYSCKVKHESHFEFYEYDLNVKTIFPDWDYYKLAMQIRKLKMSDNNASVPNTEAFYYWREDSQDRVGKWIGTTSIGHMVLEYQNYPGAIAVVKPSLVKRYERAIFVQSLKSAYTCNYTIPADSKIQVGDLLLSESGNHYVVKGVDVQDLNPNIKGPFKGHKLVTQDL